MPIPTFSSVEACMASDLMNKEFPNQSQRFAVCKTKVSKSMPTHFLKKYYGDCLGPLDFPQTDAEAKELEKLLDDGDFSPVKFQKSDAVESFIPGERGDISVISDSSVDKHREVVDPDTIDFTHFQKNPVVTFNHNYEIPPAGKSAWQKRTGGGVWKAKTIYPQKPEDFTKSIWLPDQIWGMIKSNILRGKSLGGVIQWREPTEEDQNKFAFNKGEVRRISQKAIVFEYACCPISVNNNTIVEMISKSQLNLPEEILIRDFPEVYEVVKKSAKVLEEIPYLEPDKIQTAEQYVSEKKQEILIKAQSLKNELPEKVNESIRRLMGKVS